MVPAIDYDVNYMNRGFSNITDDDFGFTYYNQTVNNATFNWGIIGNNSVVQNVFASFGICGSSFTLSNVSCTPYGVLFGISDDVVYCLPMIAVNSSYLSYFYPYAITDVGQTNIGILETYVKNKQSPIVASRLEMTQFYTTATTLLEAKNYTVHIDAKWVNDLTGSEVTMTDPKYVINGDTKFTETAFLNDKYNRLSVGSNYFYTHGGYLYKTSDETVYSYSASLNSQGNGYVKNSYKLGKSNSSASVYDVSDVKHYFATVYFGKTTFGKSSAINLGGNRFKVLPTSSYNINIWYYMYRLFFRHVVNPLTSDSYWTSMANYISANLHPYLVISYDVDSNTIGATMKITIPKGANDTEFASSSCSLTAKATFSDMGSTSITGLESLL